MTAEGIEDPEILAKLQKMGELKGQGYVYGRPENAEDVRRRLGEIGLLVAPENLGEDSETVDGERRAG